MCPFVMLQDTTVTFSNQVICPSIIRKPIRAYSILIFWVLFTPFALKSAENLLFCVFLVKICPLFTKKTKTLWTIYGWGSTASRLKPLRGGYLLFVTKFPEIPGTHFIDLGRMKGWVDFGATQWFWTWEFSMLTTRPL